MNPVAELAWSLAKPGINLLSSRLASAMIFWPLQKFSGKCFIHHNAAKRLRYAIPATKGHQLPGPIFDGQPQLGEHQCDSELPRARGLFFNTKSKAVKVLRVGFAVPFVVEMYTFYFIT